MADPVIPVSGTSLSEANFGKTVILGNIFNILLNMTTAMQNIAAAQADRLKVYTAWQKAYTDKMSQVHTFIAGGDDHLGTGDYSSERQQLNQLNTGYIQTLQNKQSVVSDDAKALQSNINQSNDAVSQQSNLATALIQEMNTLLSAIYR